MWDSLQRGHKLALTTLAVELALALALGSPSLGLFAMMAMPFVGLAWLPAAVLSFRGLRDQPGRSALGALGAVASAIAGLSCLYLVAKWTSLGVLA